MAHALLARRCDHDRCWVISGPGDRRCLPATVEPLVLVAACLQVCPATGVVHLRRGGQDTTVGCRWPFDLARATALVALAAAGIEHRSPPARG